MDVYLKYGAKHDAIVQNVQTCDSICLSHLGQGKEHTTMRTVHEGLRGAMLDDVPVVLQRDCLLC